MKHLLSLTLALVTSGAVASRAPHAEPRPLVVLVHGRGQIGVDTTMLRRDWTRELDTALAGAGLPALRSEDVRFAWYADVLDPEATSPCERRVDTIQQLGLGDITRLLFASLTSAIPEDESSGARGLLGELLYFMDGSVRCAASRRLDAVVRPALATGRPVVIVAYSLGAVIAHDYLSSLPATSGTIHLVTAGSPLGMREFRELLFGVGSAGPRKPASVSSWTNVYDPEDPFSAPVVADSVVDRRVEKSYGGSAHHHGRYLRDPAMGRALQEILRD